MVLTSGTRLGVYEIVGLLGEGGMGQVYRARDMKLHRDVALKVLPEAFIADPDRAARFEREAQALAALNHPNIAQIYGIEESEPRVPGPESAPSSPKSDVRPTRALVMELVEGEDLSGRMHRGPVRVDDAISIARQITRALEAAHTAGLIHRDLKPANVKITPDGTVKVLDFGLAKAVAPVGPGGTTDAESVPTMTTPAMTQQGVILGTAAYMSPEQARGHIVDKRTDIWAFGCVLFEMFTGTPPFGGDNVTDVLAAVVTKEPDWSWLPRDVPRSVRRLLFRCLHKEPKQRLHDIADARLELDALDDERAELEAGPGNARNAGWSSHAMLAVAALAVTAGAGLGFSWRSLGEAPPRVWSSTRLGGAPTSMRPHLSPDGNLLAFLSMDDGLSQVSVMRPGTGEWTQLTRDRAHGLTYVLCWSADGASVYYDRITDTANGIYSVPALGGDERLVVENAQSPASLADGSLLFGRVNAERVIQLHRLSPESGEVEPLPVALAPDSTRPIVPIDATRIVIHGRALDAPPGRDALWVFDLVIKELHPVAGGIQDPVVSVAVDPRDGSAVIAVRDGSSYLVLRAATDGSATTNPLFTLLSRPALSAAPDGSLYVGIQSRPAEILRFAVTGKDIEHVGGYEGMQGGLAPLPDGRALAVWRIGSGPRVLVLSPGKDPVRLVETGEDTRFPMTAVGDDRAAVLIGAEDSPDISIVAVNTGRVLKRITAPAAPTSLGASPDGRTLYVAAAGLVSAISIVTGETREIAAGDSFVVDPDTGDLIVRLDESTGYRLVRLPARGGMPVPIPIDSDLRMVFPPLTPGSIRHGQMVLPVASVDSSNWFVAVLDLATGTLNRVNVRPDLDFHYAAWAPDGRLIAYGVGNNATLWKFSQD